jgi:formamidopyrimidine-DNA glycosylase
MPELPEVEVLRRGLERLLPGDRIAGVEVRHRGLRERVQVRELERRCAGRGVLGVRRRGKYVLLDLEGGSTLVVHLGMSGRLTVVPAATPTAPHEHLRLPLASGRDLRFRDPRRFGLVFAAPTEGLENDPHFAALGVEPLTADFTGQLLLARARATRRRAPVKNFLLDGRAVVGVGNIYASEALFAAGIHPRRSVGRLSAERWTALAAAVRRVLRRAIREGGTTLNDFADADGQAGEFQGSLAVYGRAGESCRRCRATIRRTVMGARSTYYCPRCQR